MRHCETLVSVWVQSLSDEKCRNTWNTQNAHTTSDSKHFLRAAQTPSPIPNTTSHSKHHSYYQQKQIWSNVDIKNGFHHCVSLFNIRGVNQKHYYTLVKFGRMLPNFFQEVVEFKSNTPRAEALGVFDLNSTTSLKKFGSILPNSTRV